MHFSARSRSAWSDWHRLTPSLSRLAWYVGFETPAAVAPTKPKKEHKEALQKGAWVLPETAHEETMQELAMFVAREQGS